MKLSISNIAWSEENDEEIYEFLREKNFDLEIAPTRIIKKDPYDNCKLIKNIAQKLKKEYNLNIISMQSIWYGKKENIFENNSSKEYLFKYTKKAIDFANYIGCQNLVFGCPKNRNMINNKKDYLVALDFFKNIGYYALSKNVVVAIEPNPKIYNTNFLNYTSDVVDFVKKINLPSIKINYDLGTVIYNNEDISILKDNINLINHIHISEPNLEKISHRKIYDDLFRILKKIKYNNYISLEMKQCKIDDVKKAINYIIKLDRLKNEV